MPRPMSPTPMTMVAHGRYSSSRKASGLTTRPNVPNTRTNPAVSASETVSARPTAPARPPLCSIPTNAARYAGSRAKPQGLTVAAIPAARANAKGPFTLWRVLLLAVRQISLHR